MIHDIAIKQGIMKKLFFTLFTFLLPMLASADAVEIDGVYYNLINKVQEAEVTSNPNKYKDVKTHYGNIVSLTATYNLSVYATKAGYENSDMVSATLCWIEADPKTEGITNSVANVRAKAVLIQTIDNTVSISGADEGTLISIYDISGKIVGSAKAISENTTIPTSLNPGDIGLVKIGEKSIKIIMK